MGSSGLCCRLVVATHPAGPTKKRIGVERDGLIYELFLTKLPQEAFTAADVVALYLHRGAFETTLSDEDMEQEPDRWCSHAACGQEVWQIVSQWVWNLRLELGHQLEPEPLRTTEFAPALSPTKEPTAPACGYAPAVVALPFKQGRFSGCDFALQTDDTLSCPAGQALFATEERREADGSLRLVYAARISHCRDCRLREQCQWHGGMAGTPRNHVGSVYCFIPSKLALLPCSGVTGAAGSTVEPVCNSYVTNELTCTWSLSINLTLLRLHRSFLVLNAPISGSRGKSDSHAMRLPQRLVCVRSPSSGCLKALRPRWVY
ncbi:hypothetical protein ccbrp13_21660 [Ktedonobacteria bacterium brp13]|nr:hypothetical protein ccbrp13_21660 [Ktedonobacteria bacterium brp13]